MGPTEPPTAPLAGLRVVEIGQGIAESFAGKMFAAQGADVIKVESPREGGDDRRTGPDAESHRFGHSPGYFRYLNMSKRSVTLDIGSDDGARLLTRLLATADVLIDGTREGALALMRAVPTVFVSVSRALFTSRSRLSAAPARMPGSQRRRSCCTR